MTESTKEKPTPSESLIIPLKDSTNMNQVQNKQSGGKNEAVRHTPAYREMNEKNAIFETSKTIENSLEYEWVHTLSQRPGKTLKKRSRINQDIYRDALKKIGR